MYEKQSWLRVFRGNLFLLFFNKSVPFALVFDVKISLAGLSSGKCPQTAFGSFSKKKWKTEKYPQKASLKETRRTWNNRDHFKGAKNCNRLKSWFFAIFFSKTTHQIFLKFVPCFIDINSKYKNYLRTFSDTSTPPAQSLEVGSVEKIYPIFKYLV